MIESSCVLQVITRAEAKAGGLKRYYTGKPCKRGHVAERIAGIGQCVRCVPIYRKKHRDRKLTRQKQWHQENREQELIRMKKCYQENRDRVLIRVRQYKQTDKGKAVVHAAEARRRRATGSHTAADEAAILRAQNNCCAYCGHSLDDGKHLDHIHPLSRGGTDDQDNLQWLCPDCNQRKRDKLPIRFVLIATEIIWLNRSPNSLVNYYTGGA
jgi:5-methylcytosine-specific restriction endonuclease McrA